MAANLWNSGTQEKRSPDNNSAFYVQPPSIQLPKGGGAIKGISEQFAANPATGTSSFSISLPVSPARGFEPQLSLNYDSGAGNGPFGLGWTLAVPGIGRKTEKGLPEYLDRDESDTFVIVGAQDLVPLLKESGGNWLEMTALQELAGIQWEVKLYRPRIEGTFTKIERWRNPDTGIIWWRTTSGKNVTSVFGYNPSARIADPADPTKIFKWLIDCSYDVKGHFTKYIYKTEDMVGVDYGLAFERHRKTNPVAQTYLKRVWYGIKKPHGLLYENFPEILDKPFDQGDFHFQTVFDYGEHTGDEPAADEPSPWDVRPDPFSDYRAGFEVRTYRRCRRVLPFHQFENKLPTDCEPVREMAFAYDDQNEAFAFLTAITSTGYKRDADGTLRAKSLPSMTFGYQAHAWNTEVKTINSDSLHNLPSGVAGRQYQWIDLYREGLGGVLTEQAQGLYYKQNLGNATFAEARRVSPAPSLQGLAGGVVQLRDLEGNGSLCLVATAGPVKGFYRSGDQTEWQNFVPFKTMPTIDFQDPNLRVIDLDGDGRPDLLVSEERAFRWHPSAGEAGYGEARMASKAQDEDDGPAIVFANESESIFLADMTGDGLQDIVRIRNASVVYWPNLGYGRFGAKVAMACAPGFNHPDLFDPGHIRLADLDGSGPTDMIYLGKNEFRYWLNQSGNSWSAPYTILNPFPDIDSLATVSVMDLLGTGTACVVWSSPLPVNSGRCLRYVDLMQSTKPHLMTNYQNGMGKEVNLSYTPSTQFYLEDKQKGEPWITRLHFPVHCLTGVETVDHITKARFASSFSYHHGHYDHAEREFRGFGRVDQIDIEDYDHFVKGGSSNVLERVLHQSPVLVKTWFHTGFYLDQDHILSQFRHEYFASPALENIKLGEPMLPADLTAAEWREALRACKGMALRSEVYGLDGTEAEARPYSVAQNTCEIKRIQPSGGNRYASFQVINSETLSLQLDRNPEDPRISHSLVLQTDAYGNPIISATVGYPRLSSDLDVPEEVREEQAKTHVVMAQADYTHDEYGILGGFRIDGDHQVPYLLPVAWKTRTYELSGTPPLAASLFSRAALFQAFVDAETIGYEDLSAADLVKRPLAQSETRFLNDSLDGPRVAGELSPLNIAWQTYQLAFTPTLLQSVYGDKVASTSFDGGYVDLNADGDWWVPSGTPIYGINAARRFYLPEGARDPWGNPTWTDLDGYLLLPIRSRDAKQNETLAFNDYRTLRPQFVRDANHNWTAVDVDELGMVIQSAIMGKVSGLNDGDAPAPGAITEGDNLEYPSVELSYSFYEPATNQPAHVYTRSYVNHHSVDASEERADFLQQYAYSDGSGNIVMLKKQAEPGLAKRRNQDGTIEDVDTGTTVRWIGNGRTILNNKGNPVKQYEPYFSVTPEYENDPALVEIGFTPILFYDAAGRMDCKLNPNHSYEKVVFDPWQQTSWDVNDTLFIKNEDGTKNVNPANDPHVGHYFAGLGAQEYLPSWYGARIDGALGPGQQRAAQQTEPHAATPAQVHTDALGRIIYRLEDNGEFGRYETRTILDIEGNPLAVIDDRGNAVMAYADYGQNSHIAHHGYNMLPPQDKDNPKPILYQASLDGGRKWALFNVLGNPIRSWDSRGHIFETLYDDLNRPVQNIVTEDGRRKAVVLTRYFDSDGADTDTARSNNLIGTAYQSYDPAGLAETRALDFKGNPISSRRTLTVDYTETYDWGVADPSVLLQTEYFETTAEYDALNRVIHSLSPHNPDFPAGEFWLGYNSSGAVDTVDAAVRGGERTAYVVKLDYDARGQRQKIEYGNSVVTDYEYDLETYRLKRLVTRRSANEFLQDLNYCYDPVGNISQISDHAQQTLFFSNEVVEPHTRYVYDSLYRLIEARGREHARQNASPSPDNAWLPEPHPNDGNAMRRYTQMYTYDGVGNILKMAHRAGTNGWTRSYLYAAENNRLLATTLGDPSLPFDETYDYNAHGSMTRMPHLRQMDWDFAEQLYHVDLNGGGHAWYVYDAAGRRTRKVVETNGTLVKERIYLGGWEIYRETVGGQVRLERETLHVMDDQRRIALIECKTIDDCAAVSDPSPVVRYQMANHLGSASLELSDDGNIISYEEYYPFGTTAFHAGISIVEESPKRYRHTGKERDDETGLAYHGIRYLAGWLARWCSVDPLVTKSPGKSTYISFANNPLFYVDPDGLSPKSDFIDAMHRRIEGINIALDNGVSDEETRALGTELRVYEMINSLNNLISMTDEDWVNTIGNIDFNSIDLNPGHLIEAWATNQAEIVGPALFGKNAQEREIARGKLWFDAGWTAIGALIDIGPALTVTPKPSGLMIDAFDRGPTVSRSATRRFVPSADPAIRIDPSTGTPIRLSRSATKKPTGPAYATLDEARAAASPKSHILNAYLEKEGEVVAEWFEISEVGLGKGLAQPLGDTEQLALARLNPDMTYEGYRLVLTGTIAPCDRGPGGCAGMMESTAQALKLEIDYAWFQPGAGKPSRIIYAPKYIDRSWWTEGY